MYWAPALLKDGRRSRLDDQIYYRDRLRCEVVAFPPSGRLPVDGDTGVLGLELRHGAHRPCIGGGTPGHTLRPGRYHPDVRRADATGRSSRTPDHRSHVAYGSNKTGCPADRPIQLPAIKVNIRYGVSNCIAAGCSLSSDMMGDLPGGTFHADFWNTWDQSVLEQLVQAQRNS